MFWGEHSIRIDEKGRLFLPARFRPLVEEGVAVLKDTRKCLTVLPIGEFQRRAQDAMSALLTSQKSQDFTRRMGSSMVVDTPDKQGRITLTPQLMSFAGLERDAMIVGALNRAEIWQPEAWAAERERIDALGEDYDEGEGIAVL